LKSTNSGWNSTDVCGGLIMTGTLASCRDAAKPNELSGDDDGLVCVPRGVGSMMACSSSPADTRVDNGCSFCSVSADRGVDVADEPSFRFDGHGAVPWVRDVARQRRQRHDVQGLRYSRGRNLQHPEMMIGAMPSEAKTGSSATSTPRSAENRTE